VENSDARCVKRPPTRARGSLFHRGDVSPRSRRTRHNGANSRRPSRLSVLPHLIPSARLPSGPVPLTFARSSTPLPQITLASETRPAASRVFLFCKRLSRDPALTACRDFGRRPECALFLLLVRPRSPPYVPLRTFVNSERAAC